MDVNRNAFEYCMSRNKLASKNRKNNKNRLRQCMLIMCIEGEEKQLHYLKSNEVHNTINMEIMCTSKIWRVYVYPSL